MTFYYKTTKGTVIRNYDVEQAYLISTGKYRWESEKDYLLWLNSIWGKYIISAHKASEIDLRELVKNGQKFMATHISRELHDCSAREALDVINKIESEVNANGNM